MGVWLSFGKQVPVLFIFALDLGFGTSEPAFDGTEPGFESKS